MKANFSESIVYMIILLTCFLCVGCSESTSDTINSNPDNQHELIGAFGVRSRGEVEVADDDMYKIRMMVWLTDIHGDPVSGNTVFLHSRPYSYSQGRWIYDNDGCSPEYYNESPNEDANRNYILDEGEDINGDGELTPRNSAGGTAPASVVTDGSGTAYFEFMYPKSSAPWIRTEITATTWMYGAELSSVYLFRLPYPATHTCNLPDSPYNEPAYVQSGDKSDKMKKSLS